MDDSCAVCAETLQWVAYGPCGHREVCSTCTIRLRFICGDSHCCLCKSESKIIFVTKALGDYTRMINDFSVLPTPLMEGQLGPYWYHEGTQAFFDDVDHYKMIKTMCRLSCSLCNKINEQRSEGSKKKGEFKNVEQLKSHLFHRHRLFMCSLCLEGRKIFICEQKLYTKAQLDRHTETGDSEVDGSESERGGFKGHPMCEFCKNPFYGDNELYMHMSTEHFTCHICQRQCPGQYEYYSNYDNLEIHFQQAHFLCKDDACLTKKFVVFATESEMKRHNAKEHGGNMSRSRRNAALQIPISFRCRRSNEEDHHGPHSGGHVSDVDAEDNRLFLTVQASVDTANAERFRNTSSSVQAVFDRRRASDSVIIAGRFESLATTETESSVRCSNASRENSRNVLAEESAFPPLPLAQSSRRQKFRNGSERMDGSTMASQVRRLNTVNVLNSSSAWPTARRQPKSSASSSHQLSSSSSPVFSQSNTATINRTMPSGYASSGPVRQAAANGFVSSNFLSTVKSPSTSKVGHSTSAPNLVERGSIDSDFPTVSSTRTNREPANSQTIIPKVGDVQTANKSLVEKIRDALEFDESKFTAFKEISGKYRKDLINTGEYLACVDQFGLSHLVLELAQLCPDAEKRRELVETYNFNVKSSRSHGINLSIGGGKSKSSSKKGKEKCVDNGISSSKDALKLNCKPPVEDAVVVLKNDHRCSKGKSNISVEDEQINLDSGNHMPMGQNGSQSAGGSSKKNLGKGANKQQKKVPKFLRNRLGDDAVALAELGDAETGPDLIEEKTDRDKDPPEGLPVRGVWQNGGGHRLVKLTMRNPPKRGVV
ncbi:uncharacterized protein LOC133721666 [Rosa rugosa]|uniref:uncharacterized protein LOC133721666 n=1 Tax=Rosa rugosa TaxID=74645 RepID=UPI002B40A927|nr:uncharacterized protein LOC133721666 [Rosa rugosa]